MPPHQMKTSQLLNGAVRPINKNSSQSSGGVGLPITNGRRHTTLDRINEKHPENESKSPESVDKLFQMPALVKSFKVPLHHDQLQLQSQPKARAVPSHLELKPPAGDGGKDVESILKMMTSTLEPLTKIAATPRTEIEVQQPKKAYVYANLPPPFFKAPTNDTCEYCY